jgi:hypothetical protein
MEPRTPDRETQPIETRHRNLLMQLPVVVNTAVPSSANTGCCAETARRSGCATRRMSAGTRTDGRWNCLA